MDQLTQFSFENEPVIPRRGLGDRGRIMVIKEIMTYVKRSNLELCCRCNIFILQMIKLLLRIKYSENGVILIFIW